MIDKNDKSVFTAHNERTRKYRRFYIPCFFVFLIATVINRLVPWHWHFGHSSSAGRKTILQEAREQAGTFVPYMFINY
ncbi:MAG: hypothetical protein R3F41_08605 [Gammaproteobacteria bacterium]|nr:hypothetical protein [Pseudomonadales bacterium]MCP5347007.1 hypothetical protein [Pseudomonadales bacterium]